FPACRIDSGLSSGLYFYHSPRLRMRIPRNGSGCPSGAHRFRLLRKPSKEACPFLLFAGPTDWRLIPNRDSEHMEPIPQPPDSAGRPSSVTRRTAPEVAKPESD